MSKDVLILAVLGGNIVSFMKGIQLISPRQDNGIVKPLAQGDISIIGSEFILNDIVICCKDA